MATTSFAGSPFGLKLAGVGSRSPRSTCRMSADGDATRVTLPDLAGKRVLVTGASGGLGKRMAIEFARQKCKVLVHYFTRREGARDTVQRCEEAGSPFAMSFGVDLRSEAAIQTLVDCVEKDFGGVDVLVNNAGIVVKSAVEDCDSKCFDDVYAVNVRAPYLLSRQLVGGMKQSGSGVVINISSIHGTDAAVEFMSAYAMSKAALNALTQSMAAEWAPTIRVLALAPGVVPVERSQKALEETKDIWFPYMPMKRYGTGDEIAKMAVFLASESSAWTTGSVVTVDGGMTARMFMPIRAKPVSPPEPSPVQHPCTPAES
uniref:Uncharacterized protein n=1 Tax=Rhodosorus marinus TaxID=101924 RepID=A0A7S2ZRW0_9RHOD|mmetsp:Transcript_29257/g.113470  ORF Transcript_29257/g.113470 Transcript_29257/m.113470 type:complete len:317 (+) Transcript_29257:802-1752(+)